MRPILPALLLAAIALAGCSEGPPRPSQKQAEIYMQGLGGRGMVLRPGTDVNMVYGEAINLKTKGDCAGAIPKLQMIANLGPGYENAQTALGECLLQKAHGSELSADYLEGLTWLRRAADAGWPEAQLQLARAHALGPTAIRNADEAAYWLAVYKANTGKARVGFVPPSVQDMAALEAAIPLEAKTAAAARAAAWQRQVWMPPAAAQAPGPTGRPGRDNDSFTGRSGGPRDRY